MFVFFFFFFVCLFFTLGLLVGGTRNKIKTTKLLNPCPADPRYTLPLQTVQIPDQLASEEANWSGICTVCHQVCEFIAAIQIKQSDWLKIRSGCDILIYSAGQGLSGCICVINYARHCWVKIHQTTFQNSFLIFPENRIRQFTQIVSSPKETAWMKTKPYFWGKYIINLSSAEFAQKMIMVKKS